MSLNPSVVLRHNRPTLEQPRRGNAKPAAAFREMGLRGQPAHAVKIARWPPSVWVERNAGGRARGFGAFQQQPRHLV